MIPLEPLNRAVFDTNTALDDAFIKPIAEAYRAMIPHFVRDRIRSAIDNLAEPRIFVNDVLQGRSRCRRRHTRPFLHQHDRRLSRACSISRPSKASRGSRAISARRSMRGASTMVRISYCCSSGHRTFAMHLAWASIFSRRRPALVVTGHAGTITGLGVGMVDGIDLRSRNIETLDEIKASALDFYAHLKSIMRQRRQATTARSTRRKG